MSDVRVRFAPSPTGTLHIGSARTALYNFLFARHHQGVMVLRVEDTDLKRSRREHEVSIIRDLHWLGLRADEGPDVDGGYGPYRQSERTALYEDGVQRLLETGWAYRCFCTQERLDALKREQLARGEMPKYDRLCLNQSLETVRARLRAGEEATVRFKVPAGDVSFDDLIHGPITFSADVIGDFILRRTDGGFAYNYAVVVDDAGMKITHVVRGEDHITNTARQLMLYRALDEPAPAYAHHSLILGPDGGKLSKRHGATSIGEFRDMGYLAGAVVNYLALLSWHPGGEREKFTLEELVAEFDMSRVSKSPAVFDLDKLNWLNGLYIREMGSAELSEQVRPYLHEEGIALAEGQRDIVSAAIQSNLVVLEDAPRYARVFVEELSLPASVHLEVLHEEGVAGVLALLREALAGGGDEYPPVEEAKAILKQVADACKDKGIKGKAIYKPLRVALTGLDQGPELFYLVSGLGRSRILERLDAALTYLDERGSA
ncbi:MAG: glutamate--tRNA ligase [Thermoleophilia bacterium]|nr:glutamate--tRNA ligase [Thermoleophilia bacterium]